MHRPEWDVSSKEKTIGVKGTDIMYFIPLNKIPQGRDTMYANYVSD